VPHRRAVPHGVRDRGGAGGRLQRLRLLRARLSLRGARQAEDGRVWKCTLCYDRLKADQEPACAKACPTNSIQFGPLDELRATARGRVEALHAAGEDSAQLYLADEENGMGGAGAFFLLLDEPEVYGLPPDPVAVTRDLPATWRATAIAGAALLAGVAAAMVGRE